MIKRLDHFVLTVADIKRCVDFYSVLGFAHKEMPARHELHTPTFKINLHLKGHELKPHATNVMPGSADLCFEVTDLDAMLQILTKANIQVLTPIVERTGLFGSMRSIYMYDPDGNLVELSSYKK